MLGWKFTDCLKILLLTCALLANLSEQISLEEFVTLSYDERVKLDEFKKLVEPKLPHDYMKEDIYLIRWLRDKNFDVKSAEKRLLNHLEWRKENKIDEIRNEDWRDIDEEYRVFIEGCSKDGKPIISIPVGDWDFRQAVLTGQSQRMMRYLDKIFEDGLLLMRSMVNSGQNVTQGLLLFDFDNFNLIQQGCAGCLRIYFHMLLTTDQYPGMVHRIIGVNVPQFAIPLWDLLKGALPKHIRDLVSFYGKDRLKWQADLLKEIDKDNLSIRYGGINLRGVNGNDLRIKNETYICKLVQSNTVPT